MMDRRFIPVAAPVLNGNEKKYVNECLDTTWISSTGKFIPLFEKSFADFCSVKNAIAVNNGTAALHLALLTLGIGPGDEVIVPTFTYVASANCVTYVGARPVFVDCDPNTWNMDVGKIESAITSRTKAILAVHIYGLPADMPSIMDIAERHHLNVVEDASEAHGAKIHGRPAGSWGHVSTFSFFGNKIITTGEGGMVLTDNDALAEKLRQVKGQGVDPARRYWFPVVGYNYRMTNIEAAIGLAQMENIDWHLAKRKQVFELYQAHLQGKRGITFQTIPAGFESCCWMVSILVDETLADRDQIMEQLRHAGIETRPFFYPMHVLPIYKDMMRAEAFPASDMISRQGLNLPSSSALSADDIQYVSETLLNFLEIASKEKPKRKVNPGQ